MLCFAVTTRHILNELMQWIYYVKSKYVGKLNSQFENACNGLGGNEHKWVSVQHIRNPVDTNLWYLRSNGKNIQLNIWYKTQEWSKTDLLRISGKYNYTNIVLYNGYTNWYLNFREMLHITLTFTTSVSLLRQWALVEWFFHGYQKRWWLQNLMRYFSVSNA